MPLPTPTITAFFGLDETGGDVFTLDDPVKSLLDNVTYVLGGDLGTDIASDAFGITINRGRSLELDEFQTGTCAIHFRNWHRRYDPLNTAGPYYGSLDPGVKIAVAIWGQTIYTGTVDEWATSWEANNDATAVATVWDAMGDLARMEFDAWTATAAQTAGPRLTAICDRPEIAYGGNRAFDTGISTLQGDSVTWGSNALNYAQLVAKSDQGRLFADRFGVLTFNDRHHLINAEPAIVFSDIPGGLGFHGITTRNGSELMYNRVGVDREGGTLQTVEDITDRKVRALGLSGLLQDSDTQSMDMAEYLLSVYKDPTTRIASLTIDLAADVFTSAERSAIARLDIGQMIEVIWTPAATGAAVDQELIIEGVSHTIDVAGQHVMTLSLSPQSQGSTFILDDPVYGLLDGVGLLSF